MRIARPRRPCAAALLLVLAGCAGSPGTDDAAGTAAAAPLHPVAAANNATACTRTLIAVFLERAEAQAPLPPGFVAADASAFFGLGAAGPVGKGVALVSAAQCASSGMHPEGYGEALVGIFVEPPRVEGTGAPSNAYELGRVMSNGTLRGLLMDWGWPAYGGTVRSQAQESILPSAQGAASAWGTWEVLRFSAGGTAATDSFSETIRWWRQTDLGLGFFEYRFSLSGHLGRGDCTVAGTAFSGTLGSANCGSSRSLFLFGPPFDVQARFEFRPGLRAA